MAEGRAALTDVPGSPKDSEEHTLVVAPVVREIGSLYERFLFRSPDPGETARHLAHFYRALPDPERRRGVVARCETSIHLGARWLKVEMDVVNQCNLRCVMCHFSNPLVHSRKKSEMPVDVFASVAAQLFPVCQQVSLSFSTEPMLHHRLDLLLHILARYQVPVSFLMTNGNLLDRRMSEVLVGTGLTQLGISVDAAAEETYERIREGARFGRLLANIELLNAVKARSRSDTPRLHFNFVMMRSNIEELPSFVRMAHDLGGVGVTASHLVRVSSTKLHAEHESLDRHQDLCNRKLDEARDVAERLGIAVWFPANFGIPAAREAPLRREGGHGVLDFLPPHESPNPRCPFPWHFMGINADGGVVPCGWWHGEEPLGYLSMEPAEQIWQGRSFRALRAEHEAGALRQTCLTCPANGVGCVDHPDSFVLK